MTQILIIFFSVLTFFSCQQKITDKSQNDITENSNDFEMTFDTLNILIEGYLRKAVLFNDNFYGVFETERKNNSQSFKKMIVFDTKGNFIEDAFIPEEIQDMSLYDLVVENDSLYIKESQYEKSNFVLGAYVADFKKTKSKELKFYEDEFYDIYASCNGEWGGTIYFKGRKINASYEASSTCPIVINKIDNEYFVTNFMGHMMGSASVLKIIDPTKLEKSELNFERHEGSRYNKGIEVLLDTMDFYIPTSFVADKQLFHVYSDDNGTYIGKIENKKMRQIYKFGFNFYAHFNQHLDNGKQLLTCHFKDSEKSGLLLIDGRKFKFYRQK